MEKLLEQLTLWLKGMLAAGVIDNLTGLFDEVNNEVGSIAGRVGTTPESFSPGVFNMIRNISETVILPIAGMVLTFIA